MIVFILEFVMWYEGSNIIGVYSTRKKAQDALKVEIFESKNMWVKESDNEYTNRANQVSYEIRSFLVDTPKV